VGIEGERTEMVDCPGYSSFFPWPVLELQQAWVLSFGLGRQHQDRVLLNFLRLKVAGIGCDLVIHVSYGRSARRCGRSRLRLILRRSVCEAAGTML